MKLVQNLIAALSLGAGAGAPIAPAAAAPVEQAVIVHFRYGSTDLARLHALEDVVEKAIKRAGAGEYDGHEIAVDGSDGFLYMYGPDADRLFGVVAPVLRSTAFMAGAVATKRYGPPGAGVRKVDETIVPQAK